MLSPAIRELARQLAAYETSVLDSSVSAEPGALFVYEKLRQRLCTLAGVGGFCALANRALTLSRLESSSFRAVQIAIDGSLQGLPEFSLQNKRDWDDQVGVILIAQLLGLLITLIGRALTLRMLHDLWPDAALNDLTSARGEDCERTK